MKALIFKISLACILAASISVCAYGYSGTMNYITDSGLIKGEAINPNETAENPPDEQNPAETQTTVPILTNHYNSVSGVISDIAYDGRNSSILLSGSQGGDIYYNISPEVLVYSLNSMEPISAGRLSKGRRVSVFYNVYTQAENFPMKLTPEVIVLHDNEQAALVKVDYFDDTGLSSDKRLKLNRNEEMLVVAKDSKIRSFDDLRDKNLLVFYDISTLSPSTQAPPMKVVILGSEVLKQRTTVAVEPENIPEEAAHPEETAETERDILFRNLEGYILTRGESRYIPLYKVAETMGWDLQWNGDTKLVTLHVADSSSYTLINGLSEYQYNSEAGFFENAPFIYDSRTYVEEAFLERLISQ